MKNGSKLVVIDSVWGHIGMRCSAVVVDLGANTLDACSRRW